MTIKIYNNTNEDKIFSINITKQYYSNDFFKQNSRLFIKMCKLLKYSSDINKELDSNILYKDVKDWIISIYPQNKLDDNTNFTFTDKINLIQNNITHLPKCKCKSLKI